MRAFEGTYDQSPPPYCANKVGGVKFYEMARRGEAVPREEQGVTVCDFDAHRRARTARSLGFRLSLLLRAPTRARWRTSWATGSAPAPTWRPAAPSRSAPSPSAGGADARRDRARIRGRRDSTSFIPFDAIPLPFEEIRTDAQQERRITHGQTVLVRTPAVDEGDWVKVVNQRGEFLAVGAVVETSARTASRVVQPKIVFK